MTRGAGTIKDMPRVERPREKLMLYGPGRLSAEELLAILIGTGTKGHSAVEIAGRMMKCFGAEGLLKLSRCELESQPGIGPVKACELLSCFELGRRFISGKKASIYLKPADIWEQLRDIRDQRKEHFVIFYLDTRNQEIKREIISIGCLNANLVHPREVFEPAVKNLAASVIAAHNHPSGCLEPSQEDIDLTKRLAGAGKLLGIELLDHVIVSRSGFSSLKEKGYL